MQTDAQVKVSENEAQAVVGKAKYDALAVGAQLDHEIEVIEIKDKSATEEAAKIRDWQTGENALDRSATIEQMLTRFEGKISEMEVRLEFENPGAAKKIEEQLIIMRGNLKQAEEINQIQDPTTKKQMYEKFRRGWE